MQVFSMTLDLETDVLDQEPRYRDSRIEFPVLNQTVPPTLIALQVIPKQGCPPHML